MFAAQTAASAAPPGLPRKGRQYSHMRALGASPCPRCAAMRERGEAAQRLRGGCPYPTTALCCTGLRLMQLRPARLAS